MLFITGQSNKKSDRFLVEVTLVFNHKKKLNKEIYFEGGLKHGHLKFKAQIFLLLNLFHLKMAFDFVPKDFYFCFAKK